MYFRQPAVTQQSGNCGLTLNIWQHMIQKDTKKALFVQLPRTYPGSKQYESGGALANIQWSDSNNGGFFL